MLLHENLQRLWFLHSINFSCYIAINVFMSVSLNYKFANNGLIWWICETFFFVGGKEPCHEECVAKRWKWVEDIFFWLVRKF